TRTGPPIRSSPKPSSIAASAARGPADDSTNSSARARSRIRPAGGPPAWAPRHGDHPANRRCDGMTDFLEPQSIEAFPEDLRRAVYDVISLRRDIRHFQP